MVKDMEIEEEIIFWSPNQNHNIGILLYDITCKVTIDI